MDAMMLLVAAPLTVPHHLGAVTLILGAALPIDQRSRVVAQHFFKASAAMRVARTPKQNLEGNLPFLSACIQT